MSVVRTPRTVSRFINQINKGVHFKTGSPEPVFPDDGKFRLLSMRFCPYAARIHLVLAAKQIPYHVAYINLHEKPEWLSKYSATLKVPALEVIDFQPKILIESLVIADYLNEVYPNPQLYPRDPIEKAEDRIFIDHYKPAVNPIVKILTGLSKDPEQDIQRIPHLLEWMEAEYQGRGRKFFFGSYPGMIDLMIWPWFEKFPLIHKLLGSVADVSKYPGLVRAPNLEFV